MIEHATVFFAFFLNVHFSCNFVKVKRNDRSRPDNSHIQYQRIPSSNRLNHLCKVRNYLEIHINTTESQSTFFIYSIPFCVCLCVLQQNSVNCYHSVEKNVSSLVRLCISKIPFRHNRFLRRHLFWLLHISFRFVYCSRSWNNIAA